MRYSTRTFYSLPIALLMSSLVSLYTACAPPTPTNTPTPTPFPRSDYVNVRDIRPKDLLFLGVGASQKYLTWKFSTNGDRRIDYMEIYPIGRSPYEAEFCPVLIIMDGDYDGKVDSIFIDNTQTCRMKEVVKDKSQVVEDEI